MNTDIVDDKITREEIIEMRDRSRSTAFLTLVILVTLGLLSVLIYTYISVSTYSRLTKNGFEAVIQELEIRDHKIKQLENKIDVITGGWAYENKDY